jgi:hypothetical protein
MSALFSHLCLPVLSTLGVGLLMLMLSLSSMLSLSLVLLGSSSRSPGEEPSAIWA